MDPTLALILGWMLGMVSEYVRWRLTRSSERDRLAKLRALEIQDRRDSFQRETLVATQEVVLRLHDACVEAHVANAPEVVAIPNFSDRYPDDLKERLLTLIPEAQRYSVRIQDHELSGSVLEITANALKIARAKSETESEEAADALSKEIFKLNVRVGQLLRDVL